jgi:hypothetical protein
MRIGLASSGRHGLVGAAPMKREGDNGASPRRQCQSQFAGPGQRPPALDCRCVSNPHRIAPPLELHDEDWPATIKVTVKMSFAGSTIRATIRSRL